MLGRQGGHDPGGSTFTTQQPWRRHSHGPEETCRRVEERLTANGIAFKEKSTAYAYRVYELDRCLTSDDHTDGAAIIVFPSGAVAYRCLHNRCQGKGWADVREILGFRTEPACAAIVPRTVRSHGRGGASVIQHRTQRDALARGPTVPDSRAAADRAPLCQPKPLRPLAFPDDLVAVPLLGCGGRVHWLDRVHRAEARVRAAADSVGCDRGPARIGENARTGRRHQAGERTPA